MSNGYDRSDFITVRKYNRKIKFTSYVCPLCSEQVYKIYRKQAICCNKCRPKFVGTKIKGRKDSPEACKKKSESRMGTRMLQATKDKLRKANLGKKHSTLTKQKCSIASKGRSMSEEARIKISCGHQKINIKEFSNYTIETINYKLRKRVRNRLSCAIKNNQKVGSAVRDLGCNIEELKLYLESKWLPGMSWDNWALDGWHIDHIKPLSSFNLENREELKKACHYTNLQPMWAEDNLRKGSKYEQ